MTKSARCNVTGTTTFTNTTSCSHTSTTRCSPTYDIAIQQRSGLVLLFASSKMRFERMERQPAEWLMTDAYRASSLMTFDCRNAILTECFLQWLATLLRAVRGIASGRWNSGGVSRGRLGCVGLARCLIDSCVDDCPSICLPWCFECVVQILVRVWLIDV